MKRQLGAGRAGACRDSGSGAGGGGRTGARRARGLCLAALVLVVVTGLLPGTPQTASAVSRQVHTHRAATFNIQYGSVGRWQSAVFPVAKQVEVLALQEVRDEQPDPDNTTKAAGRVVPSETTVHTTSPRATYVVERFRWVNCALRPTAEPARPCVIYKMNVPGNRNRALALVVNQVNDEVDAVNVIPPQAVGGRLTPGSRPALGIRLTDGTWFYCIHATNRVGTSQTNDAPFLVDKVEQAAGNHWAVMGDFNRTPDSLPADPAGRRTVVRSGRFTHPRSYPRTEFDYMVAKGIPAQHDYTAFRLRYMDQSDHYPVGFWNSTSPDGHDIACAPEDELLRAAGAPCVVPRHPVIVSMGDSYASGEAGRWAGNANTHGLGTAWGTDRAAVDCLSEDSCGHDLDRVYGATSYAPEQGGNRCDRSDTAPIVFAEYPRVDPWQHFDIACSGATTYEITHPYAEKNEPAQTEQLAYIASNYKVEMVTLSIGGNDLGFADIVRDCAKRFLRPPPLSWFYYGHCADAWGGMTDELRAVEGRVRTALSAIGNTMTRAGYKAGDYRLVVESYPAPLPPSKDYRYAAEDRTRYSEGGCPFYDADIDWARQTLVRGLKDRLRSAAAAASATFLDLDDVFAHHELCSGYAYQATKENSAANPLSIIEGEWVRWIPYLYSPDFLWESQGDQQESLHPNAFGQEALGACLTDLGSMIARPTTTTDFTCVNDPAEGIVVRRTGLS
ncbi:hypothetical protein [Streptomyces sp. NPDC053048]|uniref:hypothetical protein n=1 Tax=Streptomyces sp. NPDC053048 TaxID=3365694 RepID=UPI0037CEBC10